MIINRGPISMPQPANEDREALPNNFRFSFENFDQFMNDTSIDGISNNNSWGTLIMQYCKEKRNFPEKIKSLLVELLNLPIWIKVGIADGSGIATFYPNLESPLIESLVSPDDYSWLRDYSAFDSGWELASSPLAISIKENSNYIKRGPNLRII